MYIIEHHNRYVNPKNISRTCSRCGQIDGSLKEERVLKCKRYELKIDRDLNASINILNIGMALCGSGSRLPKVEGLRDRISEVSLAMSKDSLS